MFGTGGEMLKTLSLLLSHLHGLNDLTLRELQLEAYECSDFIDDVHLKFLIHLLMRSNFTDEGRILESFRKSSL